MMVNVWAVLFAVLFVGALVSWAWWGSYLCPSCLSEYSAPQPDVRPRPTQWCTGAAGSLALAVLTVWVVRQPGGWPWALGTVIASACIIMMHTIFLS